MSRMALGSDGAEEDPAVAGDLELGAEDAVSDLARRLDATGLPNEARKAFLLADCAESYRRHYLDGVRWLDKRLREMQAAHGDISVGVGAMLNAARWLYASAEWTAEQGAELGKADLMLASAKLSTVARSHELSAWDLASKEAALRRIKAVDPARALADAIGAVDEEARPDKLGRVKRRK